MSYTDELVKVLEETVVFLEDITAVEREKFDAAINNNVLTIEECINKEQALLLRSRGLDNKREKILEAMGVQGKTLRQTIESSSDENKRLLSPIYDELEKALLEYKEIYSQAKTAIEVNLHHINTRLEQLTGEPLEKIMAYSDHGDKVQKPKTFTSRRA